jgi:hypothetical protein
MTNKEDVIKALWYSQCKYAFIHVFTYSIQHTVVAPVVSNSTFLEAVDMSVS